MGRPTWADFPARQTPPCSEWRVLPHRCCAWYVGGTQIFLEWTDLFELCLCLHFQFPLMRARLPRRHLQEFLLASPGVSSESYINFYVNSLHDVVSLDEGWCLSIDSNTCFLPIILQITTPIQRVKGLASNSIETTLGLPNACRNHKKFLDLIPLTLFLGSWELFVLLSGLGLNINRFFIVFNLTPFHSWKIRGNLVSCKSTTKVIMLLFTVWWILPWVLLLIILFNSLNNSITTLL